MTYSKAAAVLRKADKKEEKKRQHKVDGHIPWSTNYTVCNHSLYHLSILLNYLSILKSSIHLLKLCIHLLNHLFIQVVDDWDCMLNQTNIGHNNNKFYVIQLLKNKSSGRFHVWNR